MHFPVSSDQRTAHASSLAFKGRKAYPRRTAKSIFHAGVASLHALSTYICLPHNGSDLQFCLNFAKLSININRLGAILASMNAAGGALSFSHSPYWFRYLHISH
jgi:hypothetical protein